MFKSVNKSKILYIQIQCKYQNENNNILEILSHTHTCKNNIFKTQNFI